MADLAIERCHWPLGIPIITMRGLGGNTQSVKIEDMLLVHGLLRPL